MKNLHAAGGGAGERAIINTSLDAASLAPSRGLSAQRRSAGSSTGRRHSAACTVTAQLLL